MSGIAGAADRVLINIDYLKSEKQIDKYAGRELKDLQHLRGRNVRVSLVCTNKEDVACMHAEMQAGADKKVYQQQKGRQTNSHLNHFSMSWWERCLERCH